MVRRWRNVLGPHEWDFSGIRQPQRFLIIGHGSPA